MQATANLAVIQAELQKQGLHIPLELYPTDNSLPGASGHTRSVSSATTGAIDPGLSRTSRLIRSASSNAAVAPHHEPAASDTVAVQQLLTGGTLRFLIERVAKRMNSDKLPAAASLFQKRYTSALLASVLHPLLSNNIGILADAERTEIRLQEGLPVGIRLAESVDWFDLSVCHSDGTAADKLQISTTTSNQLGNPASAAKKLRLPASIRNELRIAGRTSGELRNPAPTSNELRTKVLQAVFDDNLGRLIDRIACEFGLSPAIMWGNVGNYVGYLNEQYQAAGRNTPGLQQHLDALLASRGFAAPPLGSTYRTVRLDAITPPESVRVRSTCCLWYQFPGNHPCVTCPRLCSKERAELLSKYREQSYKK